MSKSSFYDPREGLPAIQWYGFDIGTSTFQPARTNCFIVCHIRKGRGIFWANAGQYAYGPRHLLFLAPYQHIRIAPEESTAGDLVRFHANFLCVETFHAETGCSGVLFNNPYGTPAVALDRPTASRIEELIESLRSELATPGLAREEAALAYLKLLLITASRRKMKLGASATSRKTPRHPAIEPLTRLIEENYRSLHSPAEYASLLHMTPKTLGRIVREQLGKSLTDLVRDRILTHAKWQLLHTLRPVKEIAREVGFGDELYFSRFFKKGTGVSPTSFREFETEIRGGSNLSMSSSRAPILYGVPQADHSPSQ